MSFDLGLISKYRTQLMGFTIIWVVTYHLTLPLHEIPIIYGPLRLGNIAVDLFLLVSGLGLFFSWKYSCHDSILTFYKRRFVRIVPMYLIFVTIYSAFIIIVYDRPISTWFMFITTSQFWLSDPASFWKFWFVPAILFMYLICPIFFKLAKDRIIPAFFITAAILLGIAIIAYNIPNNQVLYSIFLPIRTISFFLGVVIGYLIDKKTVLNKAWTLGIIIGSIIICAIYFPWLAKNWINPATSIYHLGHLYFWIPNVLLVAPLCMLLSKIFSLRPNSKYPILSFLGQYSLAIYLVHQPIIAGVDSFITNPYIANSISVLLTIPSAYIFQKVVYKLTDRFAD